MTLGTCVLLCFVRVCVCMWLCICTGIATGCPQCPHVSRGNSETRAREGRTRLSIATGLQLAEHCVHAHPEELSPSLSNERYGALSAGDQPQVMLRHFSYST